MAESYEIATDEGIAILEKAIKTKPKETKARIGWHKKANTKLKELHTEFTTVLDDFGKRIDRTTRILQEAFGVASSEAKLFDREIVRHLKRAIKQSKEVPRPKGWTDNYDKAVKKVAAWDPKGESVDELKEGIKLLEAGKKAIKTGMAAHRKEELECNAAVDKALEDLNSLGDERVKALLTPYFDSYREFFQPPD
jgi:hypothetical protein